MTQLAAGGRGEDLATVEQFEGLVMERAEALIPAAPTSIRTEDLSRALDRLKLAFLQHSGDEDFRSCVPSSVARCVALSAMTGLFPGGPSPDVDLIPRRNRKRGGKKELCWQISYRGYRRLCRRTPGWDMSARCVMRGDLFSYRHGLDPALEHEPSLPAQYDERDPAAAWDALVAAYVVIERPMLKPSFAVLSKDEIARRRKCAQDQSFWNNWPLEKTLATMCRYAGQRELYPTDDPTRYALQADTHEEVGESTVRGPAPLTLASLSPPVEPTPALPESSTPAAEEDSAVLMRGAVSRDYMKQIHALGRTEDAAMKWGDPERWLDSWRDEIRAQISDWEKEAKK